MGSLILCHKKTASIPYFFQEYGLNIYSMEELCFFINNNIYLINKSFLREELVDWIEDEIDLGDIAEQLRKAVKDNSIIKFVTILFQYMGYVSEEELSEIVHILSQARNENTIESKKRKANSLFDSGKINQALDEYLNILKRNENINSTVLSQIYNNIASCYCRKHEFDIAIDYFNKAYSLTNNNVFREKIAYILYINYTEEEYNKKIIEMDIDKSTALLVKNNMYLKEGQFNIHQGNIYREEQNKQDLLKILKDDYRKSML